MKALMWASEKGNKDVAKLLLDAVANPYLKNYENATAAMISKQKGHHEISEMILSYSHK